ncbi:zinc finger CCCH domain-containing protein 20-like [Phoenix dactylifera]|uniref:Zinc finger CCCH domain-containing protein 20-like n=1 Tax=Phoenix dactylifera TaxID=42345 RepID=A0A8B7CI60_PHODC|nr:zinc finger CCCH domain-containing protein 20-like [Phoenix dactylifera]
MHLYSSPCRNANYGLEGEAQRAKERESEMAFGEGNHHNPTIQVPQWPVFHDPTAGMQLSFPVSGVTGVTSEAMLAALQRFLPSNNEPLDDSDEPMDSLLDAFSCDEFRMYEFKVRRCPRGRSHDWTECPYAHPGEKARRRDPRRFHYSGTACPEFRKTARCERGDACELAHGVFESWLHPTRYRTQFCKDGTACRRRVCFFAHTPDQLRVLPLSPRSPPPRPAPESYDGAPPRMSKILISSPRSTLISPAMSPTAESPPVSPVGEAAMNEVLTAIRKLQLSKAKSVPCSWRAGMVGGFGSPRGVGAFKAGFASLPATPTAAGGGGFGWGQEETEEFGRGMRGRLFEGLGEDEAAEGCSDAGGGSASAAGVPDFGWISELVK